MTMARSRALGDEWKTRLDLSSHREPKLYEAADSIRDTPHAGAIRIAIKEFDLSAIFCIQGVSTIAILAPGQTHQIITIIF